MAADARRCREAGTPEHVPTTRFIYLRDAATDAHHDGCPTYYDGCNCTVESLRWNIERAETAEATIRDLRVELAAVKADRFRLAGCLWCRETPGGEGLADYMIDYVAGAGEQYVNCCKQHLPEAIAQYAIENQAYDWVPRAPYTEPHLRGEVSDRVESAIERILMENRRAGRDEDKDALITALKLALAAP